MLLVCPRCSGSLPPDARACPRCGLLLSSVPAPQQAEEVAQPVTSNGRDPYYSAPVDETAVPVAASASAEYAPAEEMTGSGTAPYVPASAPSYQVPVRPRSTSAPAPVVTDTRANNAALLVPRGAVEMLPNESVVFQL